MFTNVDVPYVRTLSRPNPGAGAEFTITAPGQGAWRITSLRALFTASAAVASRVPSLILANSEGDCAIIPPSAAVTAGLAVSLSAYSGSQPFGAAAGPQLWGFPTDGVTLLPGWTLRSSTALIDVGDAWTLIRFTAVEYPTGPHLRLTPDVPYITESAR